MTRAYPPVFGGMENLSFNLTTRIDCEKKIVALKKKNRKHLIWFIPYCILYTTINASRYDVIHLGDILMGIVCLLLKPFFRKKKFIVNAHGLDITYRDKKGLFGRIYGIYLYFLTHLQQPDLVIGCSEYTRKICENAGFKNTLFIPPGIDPEEYKTNYSKSDLFDLIKRKFPLSSKYLLTLGRITKRKGISWFLENVFVHLPENTVYLIAGGVYFSEREERRILKLAKRLEVDKRTIYLGSVKEKEKHVLFKNSDIFVMPNIPVKGDMEGFGIVAIEAAASGLPVVASRLEGIRDAVENKKIGFLIEPLNKAGFHSIILKLLADETGREEFAKQGADFARNNFSWGSIAEKHLDAFKSLLSPDS